MFKRKDGLLGLDTHILSEDMKVIDEVMKGLNENEEKLSVEAKDTFVVTVGNIGNVDCENEKEAIETFDDYVAQSKSGHGRAAGESVTLFKNDEPIKEYMGTQDESKAETKELVAEEEEDLTEQEDEEEPPADLKDMEDKVVDFFSAEGGEEIIMPALQRMLTKYQEMGIEADSSSAQAIGRALQKVFLFHARKPTVLKKILRKYYRRGPKRLGQMVRREFTPSAR